MTAMCEEKPLVAMLLDNHYAPDRRVEMEATALVRSGLRVRVLAWDRRFPKVLSTSVHWAEDLPGLEVFRTPVPAAPKGGLRTFAKLAVFAWRMLRRRRELLDDAAVLVAHDVYVLPIAAVLAAENGLPLVYDAHEDFRLAESLRYPSGVVRTVTAVESRVARKCAAVVVPGECRRDRWTSIGLEPLVLTNVGSGGNRLSSVPPTWDIAYCGVLGPARRVDLLVELAVRRPDVRVVVAGAGEEEGMLQARSATLPNLDYLGWVPNPDDVLARSKSVYYGLDPRHPYARAACPNTLYRALRVGRPLIYFCGGEPARLHAKHEIGIRCAPTVEALATAVDEVRSGVRQWQCAQAWEECRKAHDADLQAYVAVVRQAAVAGGSRRLRA